MWFLDVGLRGEVCQNLIKSNIVSVIRSEYTYLYHPLNDKSTGVRGVGLFAISGCWMARRGPCHRFCSLRLLYTMILSSSTTVELYPFFIGHYTLPFSPGSLRPFLYSHTSSLPLLTRLPRYQVTMHLSKVADPDIAEVTRLASLLPTSSTPSSLTATPSRDLHVTGLRRQAFPLTCALWYRPPRY